MAISDDARRSESTSSLDLKSPGYGVLDQVGGFPTRLRLLGGAWISMEDSCAEPSEGESDEELLEGLQTRKGGRARSGEAVGEVGRP